MYAQKINTHEPWEKLVYYGSDCLNENCHYIYDLDEVKQVYDDVYSWEVSEEMVKKFVGTIGAGRVVLECVFGMMLKNLTWKISKITEKSKNTQFSRVTYKRNPRFFVYLITLEHPWVQGDIWTQNLSSL